MPNSSLLRRLLLVCCVAVLLPGCIERIDTRGNPINKPADEPIVGTHVSPPAGR